MSKVEHGIEINNQHIYNVEHDIEEEISFIDQIKALGYNNLEEFFNDKIEYEMQQVLKGQVYSVEPKDAMPTLRSLVYDNKYGIVSVYTNETCVHHGQDPSKTLNVMQKAYGLSKLDDMYLKRKDVDNILDAELFFD